MQTVTNSSFKSSVLIVGSLATTLGADSAIKLTEALRAMKERSYDVVVVFLDIAQNKEFQEQFLLLRKKNPAAQILITGLIKNQSEELLRLNNILRLAGVVTNQNTDQLENQILRALEKAQQEKQNADLQNLIQDQNEKLKSLYQDLEDRVDKRQKFLVESRRKTTIANLRWQTLREAMIAIHKALSLGEMEKLLTQALAFPLQLSVTRIFFKPNDTYFANQNNTYHSFSFFQSPLFKDQQSMGSVFFLREPGRPFNREETDFLLRISEAVSLALDRLAHIEQSETLREQWQATFNAIADPVVLINEKYEVIQANVSAQKKTLQKPIQHSKCYALLYQRETPCPHCHLGKNFRLENKGEIVDVSSQAVDQHFINLYHDITEKVRIERKILETAKLAELGTIGSSIAHELNNPLGGILSFVQLIRMDLKPEDLFYPDIVEMEDGVKRCRDIIQNLLGFTRNPDVDEISVLDLKEVINRAIKIIELQTRSQDIEIKPFLISTVTLMNGHFNMLSQAVKSLLQLAIDALIEKRLISKSFQATIEVSLEATENQWVIKILDNGPGEGRRNSLQFSISAQIIHEHGGILELSAQPRQMTMAKITLPRAQL